MALFPLDSDSRRIDSRACAIVHYQIDSDHWIFRTMSGQDVGVDCGIELAVDGKWTGRNIEAQIKGTRKINKYLLADKTTLSFPFEVKTINYGLGKSNAFLLFLVDVESEHVFFCAIQDYFIQHPDLYRRLIGVGEDQKTFNIRLSSNNTLEADDQELQAVALKTYVHEPGDQLREAR